MKRNADGTVPIYYRVYEHARKYEDEFPDDKEKKGFNKYLNYLHRCKKLHPDIQNCTTNCITQYWRVRAKYRTSYEDWCREQPSASACSPPAPPSGAQGRHAIAGSETLLVEVVGVEHSLSARITAMPPDAARPAMMQWVMPGEMPGEMPVAIPRASLTMMRDLAMLGMPVVAHVTPSDDPPAGAAALDGGVDRPPEDWLVRLSRLQAELTELTELAVTHRARVAAEARAESLATAREAAEGLPTRKRPASVQDVDDPVRHWRDELTESQRARATAELRAEILAEELAEEELDWRDELTESQRARAAAELRAETLAAELAEEKRARAAADARAESLATAREAAEGLLTRKRPASVQDVDDPVRHWRDELTESQRARAAAELRAEIMAAELTEEESDSAGSVDSRADGPLSRKVRSIVSPRISPLVPSPSSIVYTLTSCVPSCAHRLQRQYAARQVVKMSDCPKLRALAESYYKKHKTLVKFPFKSQYSELDECLRKVQFCTAEKKWRGKRGKPGLKDELLKELERAPPPSSANTATPPHAAGSPSPTSLQPGPVSGFLSLGGAAGPPEGVLDRPSRLQAELAEWHAAKLAEEKRARAAAGARVESLATAKDAAEGLETRACELLEKVAEQGRAGAQYGLARMLVKGKGGDVDEERARVLFQKASEQGHAGAQYRLACMFLNGEGVGEDKEGARAWFQKAAEQGHAGAQYGLAAMLFFGQGGGEDKEGARAWLKEASEQGDARAQFRLAYMLFEGEGGGKDMEGGKGMEGARFWFQKAAEQGHAEAQFHLADMLFFGNGGGVDRAGARAWFEKAAREGYAEAQYCLAGMLSNGEGGKRDVQGARAWFEEAAEQGHAEAYFPLAVLIIKGKGGDVGYKMAREWFQKAADLGRADAQGGLAVLLLRGKGGEMDVKGARAWFQKAAEQGYAEAQCGLAAMLFNGDGEDKDEEGARVWFEKAAEQGFAVAQCMLAAMLYLGMGGHKDNEGARVLLEASVRGGSRIAMSSHILKLINDADERTEEKDKAQAAGSLLKLNVKNGKYAADSAENENSADPAEHLRLYLYEFADFFDPTVDEFALELHRGQWELLHTRGYIIEKEEEHGIRVDRHSITSDSTKWEPTFNDSKPDAASHQLQGRLNKQTNQVMREIKLFEEGVQNLLKERGWDRTTGPEAKQAKDAYALRSVASCCDAMKFCNAMKFGGRGKGRSGCGSQCPGRCDKQRFHADSAPPNAFHDKQVWGEWCLDKGDPKRAKGRERVPPLPSWEDVPLVVLLSTQDNTPFYVRPFDKGGDVRLVLDAGDLIIFRGESLIFQPPALSPPPSPLHRNLPPSSPHSSTFSSHVSCRRSLSRGI